MALPEQVVSERRSLVAQGRVVAQVHTMCLKKFSSKGKLLELRQFASIFCSCASMGNRKELDNWNESNYII